MSSLLLLTMLTGCGGAVSPTPDPAVDPQEVLYQAVQRVLALQSGEFTLEHKEGTTVLLPGVEMTSVHGVAEIPDKFQLTVDAEVSNTFVKTSVIVIEDKAYMTNFLTGQWQEISKDILPLNFANLGQTLAGVIESVQSPEVLGVDELDGRGVYRIQGKVLSDDLSTLVPNAGSGYNVGLELWVDQADGLLLRVIMTGQLLDTDSLTTVRVLTLTNIDVPVEIVPPI